MAFYVLLTVFLYQRGSSESGRPDVVELVGLDPRLSPNTDEARVVVMLRCAQT